MNEAKSNKRDNNNPKSPAKALGQNVENLFERGLESLEATRERVQKARETKLLPSVRYQAYIVRMENLEKDLKMLAELVNRRLKELVIIEKELQGAEASAAHATVKALEGSQIVHESGEYVRAAKVEATLEGYIAGQLMRSATREWFFRLPAADFAAFKLLYPTLEYKGYKFYTAEGIKSISFCSEPKA